ncbi:fusion protein [meleucus virus]|uniref:Fusion glycoprotein F0 n=1 Tax=meleucus virus TaxID=2940994 RepID=A0AAE9KY45_9MONO|nr:fusion protein [meleucus virus]
MSYYTLTITLWLIGLYSADGQISYKNLSQVGVFKLRELEYRLSGEPSGQLMVIKLLPNVTGLSKCTMGTMEEYKGVIASLLEPVNATIVLTTTSVTEYSGNKKFFGAVIAGAALGVATAAQVTAGVALYEARQNAAQIQAIKDSLTETHRAIETIQTAQKNTVVAIQGIQDQINSQILPRVDELGCEVAEQQLRLLLLQYYTDILTTFGPVLQDPVASKITVQALARAAGGNLTGLVRTLGYDNKDLKYLLKIDGITGNIIDADPQLGTIILQIRYPTIVKIPGAIVTELTSIAYHSSGSNWQTIVPHYIIQRGYTLANIRMEQCSKGDDFVLCENDQTFPMSQASQDCLRGQLEFCSRVMVVDKEAPRFALISGNLVANCLSMTCKCESPEMTVNQEPNEPLVVLGGDTCKTYFIDTIRIQLGKQQLANITLDSSVKLGPIIVLDPIDVSNQISLVESNIQQSEFHLQESIKRLGTPERQQAYNGVAVGAAIISIVSLILTLIMIIGLVSYVRRTANIESSLSTIEAGPTLAPKHPYAMAAYNNPGFTDSSPQHSSQVVQL